MWRAWRKRRDRETCLGDSSLELTAVNTRYETCYTRSLCGDATNPQPLRERSSALRRMRPAPCTPPPPAPQSAPLKPTAAHRACTACSVPRALAHPAFPISLLTPVSTTHPFLSSFSCQYFPHSSKCTIPLSSLSTCSLLDLPPKPSLPLWSSAN